MRRGGPTTGSQALAKSAESGDSSATDGALVLDLKEHSIVWTLPKGATLKGDLECPGGALIFGSFVGRIKCGEGSIIFARGSRFEGEAIADCIYIEGTVAPIATGGFSKLTGHLLVAISSGASGQADVRSRSFAVHATKFAARFFPIE